MTTQKLWKGWDHDNLQSSWFSPAGMWVQRYLRYLIQSSYHRSRFDLNYICTLFILFFSLKTKQLFNLYRFIDTCLVYLYPTLVFRSYYATRRYQLTNLRIRLLATVWSPRTEGDGRSERVCLGKDLQIDNVGERGDDVTWEGWWRHVRGVWSPGTDRDGKGD